jgi:muramoyltetrapeptide carboxypeptidase LdcA involved in peptidoglycan recycling
LPYINLEIIKNNPKIFMGYSDTTVNHFMCYTAGLVSFYGPTVLCEFAENVSMHDYTKKWINKVLFNSKVIGEIESSDKWVVEYFSWEKSENNSKQRKMERNNGYELLQGKGIVQGELIGGCAEVLEFVKNTKLWPDLSEWEDKILFLETSETKAHPDYLRWWLRNYVAQGIIDKICGIIVGKPYYGIYYEEYKEQFIKVIRNEAKRDDLPILYNVNFGHTDPMCILPYGIKAEIDCDNVSFTLKESAVID